MKKKYNWELLFHVWLKKNLEGDPAKPYSLIDLGKEYDVPYKTIRNRASTDKWQDKLDKVRAQIEQNIVATIQDSKVNAESEVRKRQAHIARTLLDKALARLELTKPEDLTHRQAIEIIKFALPEERKALGMAEKYELTSINENFGGEYLSVEERKLRIKQADTLANQLFEYLNSHTSAIDCK
jgi:hypothetical protein